MMSPNRGVAYSNVGMVADNIRGGNQFPRHRDSLDNGLSNSKVRKVSWGHGRA